MACIVGAPPVYGQVYMMTVNPYFLRHHRCMMGLSPHESLTAQAREPVNVLVQSYFPAMLTNSAPRTSFFASREHLETVSWSFGNQIVGIGEIDVPVEPFAIAGARIETQPARFFRAAEGSLAIGQWNVVDADSKLLGTYTGMFWRQRDGDRHSEVDAV